MDNETERKLKATGKIAYGAVRIAAGIATATGHGLLGSFCKSHHMMNAAARIGTAGVKAGMEAIEDGAKMWKS